MCEAKEWLSVISESNQNFEENELLSFKKMLELKERGSQLRINLKELDNLENTMLKIQGWQTKIEETMLGGTKVIEPKFLEMLAEGREFEVDLPEVNMLQAYSTLINQWKTVAEKLIEAMPRTLVDAAWTPSQQTISISPENSNSSLVIVEKPKKRSKKRIVKSQSQEEKELYCVCR